MRRWWRIGNLKIKKGPRNLPVSSLFLNFSGFENSFFN